MAVNCCVAALPFFWEALQRHPTLWMLRSPVEHPPGEQQPSCSMQTLKVQIELHLAFGYFCRGLSRSSL